MLFLEFAFAWVYFSWFFSADTTTYWVYSIHVKRYLHCLQSIHPSRRWSQLGFVSSRSPWIFYYFPQTEIASQAKINIISTDTYITHNYLKKKKLILPRKLVHWLVCVMVALQVGRTSFLGSRPTIETIVFSYWRTLSFPLPSPPLKT